MAKPSATRSSARTRPTSSPAASPSPRPSRAPWWARAPAMSSTSRRPAARAATKSSRSTTSNKLQGGRGMKRLVLSGLVCLSFGAPPLYAQDWIPLQDGKSLAGWQASKRPESWVVEEGVFVTRGGPSHLFYVGKVASHEFRNFEFSADVMTSPGANSGIYVHTKLAAEDWPSAGYELQVINSNPPAEKMNGYIEHKMTGSVYAVRNTWVAPAKDDEWFNYRIRVVGKTIQTFINDRLICEYAEPDNAFRPADKKGRLLGSGTFALQAHDPSSVVKYKNIKVHLLPNDAVPPPGLVPLADRELDELITQASNDNIPLIDLGLTAPSGDAAEFQSHAR